MPIDLSSIFSKIVTIFLIMAIEGFTYLKITHSLEKCWHLEKSGQNLEEGNLHSKIIVGVIMIMLIFLFNIFAIIVHSQITGELIDTYIIYILLILFGVYLVTLYFLYRFMGRNII